MWERRSARGSLVQTPLGPRKSGMPESVEIPAPVSTMTDRAALSHPAMAARSGSTPAVLIDRSGAAGARCHPLAGSASSLPAGSGLPPEGPDGEHRRGDPPYRKRDELVDVEARPLRKGVEGAAERVHQVDERQQVGALHEPAGRPGHGEEDARDEGHREC